MYLYMCMYGIEVSRCVEMSSMQELIPDPRAHPGPVAQTQGAPTLRRGEGGGGGEGRDWERRGMSSH